MKRVMIFFVILFFCVGCDQSTKQIAKQSLKGRQTLSYAGDLFRLSYTENSGAFLGLGANLPKKLRTTILVVFVAMILIGLLIFVVCNNKLHCATVSSFALLIGGGLGNLMDRITNQGAVVDFMNVGVGALRSGVFNVADLAIVAGVIMLAIFYAKIPPYRLKNI